MESRAPENLSHADFNMIILESAKATSLITKYENKEWFNQSRSELEETLKNQDILLHKIRNTTTANYGLLKKLKEVRKEAQDAIATAKMLWHRKLAEDVHNMSFNPRVA